LLAALMLAPLLALPAHAGEVLDAVHARGALRVGMTGDYKPFEALVGFRGGEVGSG
jgi:ABC-type amino acid transport substrate-binding protein